MKIKEAIEVLLRMNPNDDVELNFKSSPKMVGDAFKGDFATHVCSSQFNDYWDDGPYQR